MKLRITIHERIQVKIFNKLRNENEKAISCFFALLFIFLGFSLFAHSAHASTVGPRVYVANDGDGTVSVVWQKGPNEYESVGDIQTQQSAKTMAFDPKTKRLFLSAAEMESAASASGQRMRMRPKPGTFTVLVVERQ